MDEQPLFADSWYETPRVDELRREIQRLYEIINVKQSELESLTQRVADLESAP